MCPDNTEISFQDRLSTVSQNSKVGIKRQTTSIRGLKQLEKELAELWNVK